MSSKTVWGLGLLLLAGGGAVSLYKMLPPLEASLTQRVDTALKSEGIDDVSARIDGLNVHLSLKAGATPPNATARLAQAAAAVRALQPELPDNIKAYAPRGEGYLYGPVLDVVTDTTQKPVSIAVGKVDHALSDL
ncbi:hypothetical protein [Asticcacaulis sp. YBE204]|uniref:hypothetical protein n=1 Tax=Asticcacaulis sp. YBE204 TaxID=1282363 RepID=UPI0003C3B2D2|nr:hypothetical protein [Asticcacaulis sp. YBE204]ESQ80442.1 hypothetical protein AEYBE204_04025 [Asticcacaulis sp. YBE204]